MDPINPIVITDVTVPRWRNTFWTFCFTTPLNLTSIPVFFCLWINDCYQLGWRFCLSEDCKFSSVMSEVMKRDRKIETKGLLRVLLSSRSHLLRRIRKSESKKSRDKDFTSHHSSHTLWWESVLFFTRCFGFLQILFFSADVLLSLK